MKIIAILKKLMNSSIIKVNSLKLAATNFVKSNNFKSSIRFTLLFLLFYILLIITTNYIDIILKISKQQLENSPFSKLG